MKQSKGFFVSLEHYVRKLIERSPLPYAWIIVGLGLGVLLASLFGTTLASARSRAQAIEMASRRGDYALAEQLYLVDDDLVLGASTQLELLVYPEKVIEERVSQLEEKLLEYPGSREIYFLLSDLYEQLGNQEMSLQYQEQARILDPNN
jgi:tetratricopeptide (TPR) repeat protein